MPHFFACFCKRLLQKTCIHVGSILAGFRVVVVTPSVTECLVQLLECRNVVKTRVVQATRRVSHPDSHVVVALHGQAVASHGTNRKLKLIIFRQQLAACKNIGPVAVDENLVKVHV